MTAPHHLDTALAAFVVEPGGAPVSAPARGLGAGHVRLDGRDKLTGAARYAGEEKPTGTLHGVIVSSPIASGRVLAIDAAAALAAPGVTHVVTAADLPAFGAAPSPPAATRAAPITGDAILYEGQPIAVVLAETLEEAEEGARLVRLTLEPQTPATFETAQAEIPPTGAEGNGYAFLPIDEGHGDLDAALAEAAVVLDLAYRTPTRHHNMMEPSATLSEWRGGALHQHDATQWTYGVRYALPGLLGVAPDAIHVRCPYTGGGFGAKGYVWPHQILAPAVARLAGRPVRIDLGREGCFTGTGYQPEVRHRLRLGADAEGRLLAIAHETENVTSISDAYVEFGNAGSRGIYGARAMRFTTRIRRAHVGTPTAMRAPHEGASSFALETAMDEIAHALAIDPVALRLRNDPQSDPLSGKPYSSKRFAEALREGARRFGWEEAYRPEPGTRRDGRWILGVGMAGAIMPTFRFPARARAVLLADGSVLVEAGAQEIGTGVRTILAEIAADRLGVPPERVSVRLGSTDMPETGGTFGSSTTISVGSAVSDAAGALLGRIAALAGAGAAPPPEGWPGLLAERGVDRLQAEGGFSLPGGAGFDVHGGSGAHSIHTWGAIFVEMAVDPELGLARLRRATGCYSAGRILNPVTARSQMIGSIVFGYGRAMLEYSAMDPTKARYLSKNLSGVMVPVNADIPRAIDVSFIAEDDPHASAIGVRGIGELGEVGVAAAIANAIHNATGRRIRDLPIGFHHLVG